MTTAMSPESTHARHPPFEVAIRGLMVVATGAFAVASMIHFGVAIALGPVTIADSFAGAALPEAIIAGALALGSIGALAHWRAAWGLALATTLFSLLVTLYGLTVTVRSSRTGDIAYHIAILVLLAVIAGLLLLPIGRCSLSGEGHAAKRN